MLRSATVVVAILVVLGSFGPSAGAFARDGGHGAGGGAAESRGNNFGVTPGDGQDGYGTSGLPSELRGYGRHDVWATGAPTTGP
jgi:hypothetical protein